MSAVVSHGTTRLGGAGSVSGGNQMNHARIFRMLGGGLAATLVLATVGTGAAEAKPARPGGVPSVVGVATWHSGTTYDVAASWGSVANASSYRASVVKGGTTVASATLTGLSWDPTVTSGPGAVVLQVQAVVRHRKGTTSKVTVQLPDKVAPTGQFITSEVDATKTATITQSALNDDSGVAGVTRTVNWGDGGGDLPWVSGATIDHVYATVGRYVPTVTLTDAASNSATYTLDAIVLGDVIKPTGSFTVSTGTAWSSLTKVNLTPASLSDDYSPAANIAVSVDWGDGSAPTASTGLTRISHVYGTAGVFTPKVTLTDEAHNASDPISTSAVTVTTDKIAPVVKLLLPRVHKHSVKVWKLLRGKATDIGTGIKKVNIRAVEKRGTRWFGYRPATKTWVKAATKAAAFKKARSFNRTTNVRHRWSATLAGLRKGTLVYKVSATDRVGHTSKLVIHKAALTKP